MHVLVASPMMTGTLKANAINTVKSAEGFAALGHEVTILCRKGDIIVDAETLNTFYGLDHDIKWTMLSGIDAGPWRFAANATHHIRRISPDFVFARAFVLPAVSAFMKIPTVLESHAHPGSPAMPLRLASWASRLPAWRAWVTIAPRLHHYFVEIGVPEKKLLLLPTGVNIDRFRRPADPGPSPYLNRRRPIAAYIGHLYDYKGIPTILAAAAQLPDISFHLVGGLPEDLARQQTRAAELGARNVVFHGAKPHSAVPPYLWHADALLLPPSAHHPSAEWTSPVKLGEYLAAGPPIIATDIPALRCWLDAGEADFVEPDNASALASGIRNTLAQSANVTAAEHRLQRAKTWSYANRSRRILEHAELA